MILKRIGPLSLGKVMGVVYGAMGLIFGFIFAFVSMVGPALAPGSGSEEPLVGLIFGVGGIVILPLLYGGFGLVAGVIGAFFYNVVARAVGGVVVELDDARA